MADRDDGDGDPFTGQIECRDGVLKMFYKRSREDGYWTELSNFSCMPRCHSVNKVAGRGQYYIFHCEMQGGGQFQVPLTLCDLDSSSKVCSVIEEYKRPHGGRLDLDRVGAGAGKAKLHRFLVSQIKKYQNSSNQLPAIVSSSTGFVSMEWKFNGNDLKANGYILGPEQVIPATQADAMAISLLNKVWIGEKGADNYVIPEGSSQISHPRKQEFINSLLIYHGCNKASVLAAIGYLFLTLHKKDLDAEGLKLGTMHVVGPQGSGKTTMGIQLKHMLPRQKTATGTYKIKHEETLSVHLLFKKVTQERWAIIQDPPAEDEKMNFFLDNYYEGKIAKTGASSKKLTGDAPSCGLLFIWPHEAACLDGASVTSMTKGFYIVHRRNSEFSYEDFAKMEKEWRDKGITGSAIFNTLLPKIDVKKICKKIEELMVTYHKHLIEAGHTKDALNEAHRLVHQYALVQAAVGQWKENTGFLISIDDLQTFFLDVCIPYILELLQKKKSGQSQEIRKGTSSAEDQLISKLRGLTDKALLYNVGIYHESEPVFGFSLNLASTSKAVETYLKSICTEKSIKAVLSMDSETMWFKRKADGHIYGKSKRIHLLLCPVSVLSEGIKDILKTRLETIIPNCESLDLTGNVKTDIDDAFGELYGLGNRTEKAKLMEFVSQLSEAEATKTHKFAESLMRKRKKSRNVLSSSSEEEVEVETKVTIENQGTEEGTDQEVETKEASEKEEETEGMTEEDETEGKDTDGRAPQQTLGTDIHGDKVSTSGNGSQKAPSPAKRTLRPKPPKNTKM